MSFLDRYICDYFEMCDLTISGLGLEPGDRLMAFPGLPCGTGSPLTGIPNEGMSLPSSDGLDFSWGHRTENDGGVNCTTGSKMFVSGQIKY